MTKKEQAELRKELAKLDNDIADMRPMLVSLRHNINLRKRQIKRWERAAGAIERSMDRNQRLRSLLLSHLGEKP